MSSLGAHVFLLPFLQGYKALPAFLGKKHFFSMCNAILQVTHIHLVSHILSLQRLFKGECETSMLCKL